MAEAPIVQIDTSMGSFEVELYHKHAPKTVKNFVDLSKRGYYDGTKVCALLRAVLGCLHAAASAGRPTSITLASGACVAKGRF